MLIHYKAGQEPEAGSGLRLRGAAFDHQVGHNRRTCRRAPDDPAAFQQGVEFAFNGCATVCGPDSGLVAAAEPHCRGFRQRLDELGIVSGLAVAGVQQCDRNGFAVRPLLRERFGLVRFVRISTGSGDDDDFRLLRAPSEFEELVPRRIRQLTATHNHERTRNRFGRVRRCCDCERCGQNKKANCDAIRHHGFTSWCGFGIKAWRCLWSLCPSADASNGGRWRLGTLGPPQVIRFRRRVGR